LVGLEPPGLPLLAFKQAEDAKGFVLRLCDFVGAGGNAKLTLPKPAGEAFLCNLVEAIAASQESHGKTATPPPSPILSETGTSGRKTVVVPLKPFGLTTVKVRFD
jgi:alpha-mannosidase